MSSAILVTADTVPEDLIALELERRAEKARYDASRKLCRYVLYSAEKAISTHPWIVERKTDWRAARKALKNASDAYAAKWEACWPTPDDDPASPAAVPGLNVAELRALHQQAGQIAIDDLNDHDAELLMTHHRHVGELIDAHTEARAELDRFHAITTADPATVAGRISAWLDGWEAQYAELGLPTTANLIAGPPPDAEPRGSAADFRYLLNALAIALEHNARVAAGA